MKASFRRPWDRTRARDKQHSAWINYGHVSAFQTRPSTEGCMLCVGFETSWWFFSSKVERKAFMGQGWTCLGRWVFFFLLFLVFSFKFFKCALDRRFPLCSGFRRLYLIFRIRLWVFADRGLNSISYWVFLYIFMNDLYKLLFF